MIDLEVISLGSAIAAIVVNIVAYFSRSLLEHRSARKKLESTQEEQFQIAMQSDSLETLGSYVDDSIGKFQLSEYSRNKTVRRRVDLFVSKLEEFLGSYEDIAPTPSPTPESEPPDSSGIFIYENPDADLRLVEDKLVNGQTWDALASLRRTIEVRLRKFAEMKGTLVSQKMSAGRIIQLLSRNKLLPSGIEQSLKYVVNVANRGIHGEDISDDVGLEAYGMAYKALAELELVEDH